ncbi:MAG: hypothetical protein WD059_03720 [Balneolaceae bacterium]
MNRINWKLFFCFILTVTIARDIQSQDTLLVFPSAKEVDVNISNEIQKADKTLIYSYSVESTASSKQDIDAFYLEIPIESLKNISAPTMWRGSKSVARKEIILWGSRKSQFDIPPLSNLDGFNFQSSLYPSVVTYYVSGRIEIPKVPEGEAPPLEFIKGADIFENSVQGKTIGPSDLPDPFIAENFLDTLISYKNQSCELGWIENPGTCRSLEAKLDNIKRQLEQGRNQTAANNLQAFLNEVEAIREQQLSPEAYALLKFNGEYLLEKLRE